MDNAKWYFTHETEEDRLWYHIFFSMCRKFGVSWPKASKEQKRLLGRSFASIMRERRQSGMR